MTSAKADWHGRRWPIGLSKPPTIIQMGIGVHGVSGSPSVEHYRMPDLWCLHIYNYEAEVEIGGQLFPIRPGYVSIVPPDVTMRYRYPGRSTHLYCHFQCPSQRGSATIPAMQELGEDFTWIYRRYFRIVSRIDSTPEQRQALLWDLLWLLTENQVVGSEETDNLLAAGSEWHPAVWKALNRIEQHLSEPLTISSLAQEAGVSYSYLARLFQQALGKSVVGYIRHRRVERATHLLRHSTLPIKAIAAAVGIPDLHLFNKVIHQALDCSPRAFRQANYRK